MSPVRLRRYCVTFSDDGTPARLLWTAHGALAVADKYAWANAFIWKNGEWQYLIARRTKAELQPSSIHQ